MNISKIADFITTDIWRIQIKNISRTKAMLIKQLRTILLALKGFNENNCQLRASALTFYSLLSIVPVAAMAFGIAKGFGFEQMLEKQLLMRLPGQEDVIVQIIAFAHSLLENTKGGLIAGIGVAVLFWSVIKVLGNIEKSFNDIWGIREARSMGRKFGDYLSLMLLCPILIIASGSITVFITTQITLITEKIGLLGFFSPAIFFLLNLLPYCVLWLLFTFVYVFMPNTKVKLSSGLLAGIVAGTIFQVVQWAYIAFQIGMAKYNAIYGSFAALPLFLIWLQLSWLVVLLGAELSFAYQNVDTYELEPDALKASTAFKKTFALRIVQIVVKNFHQGNRPLSDVDILERTGGPIRLVRQLLFELADSGVLSEVNMHKYKNTAYQPAREVNDLTIKFVIDAIENRGSNDIPFVASEEMKKLQQDLKTFNDMIDKSEANVLLKNI